MSEERPVDVSIVVLTYFHEKYIAQALDSILAQETNLRYEILVGDDASQDRTPEIIREYAARYPDIIKPVLRPENLGATRNAVDMCFRARGYYHAMLEGDDFWLDPHKLQKQWEFLEAYPAYIGCGGKCLIVDEDGRLDYTRTAHFAKNKKVFTLDDFLESWEMPAQAGTLMYRNIFLQMDPEDAEIIYQAHPIVGDKTVALMYLSRGPVYCTNEVLSAYRRVIKKGSHNWSSMHRDDTYWNYDNFMYPKRLETWSRKVLKVNQELGNKNTYHFCSFVEDLVKEPSFLRARYLAEMIFQSHNPIKYSLCVIKAIIEME